MKILITGAGGFIGRSVLQSFLSSGFNVVTLGRSDSDSECPHHKIDLMDRDGVRRAILHEKPTHLVHLAWYTEHGKFWDSTHNFSWVLATNCLIKEFIAGGGEHISVSGTCAEYAFSNAEYIKETELIKPNSLYGFCKHMAHLLARQQLENCDVKLAWFRIFFPYGNGDTSSRLIPTLHRINTGLLPPIAVDKNSIRDFIHVDDIAMAFKLIILKNNCGTYNLCSGTAVAIGDLIDAVAACYPKPVNILSSDVPQEKNRIVGEVQKLRDAGWKPSFDVLESQRDLRLFK